MRLGDKPLHRARGQALTTPTGPRVEVRAPPPRAADGPGAGATASPSTGAGPSESPSAAVRHDPPRFPGRGVGTHGLMRELDAVTRASTTGPARIQPLTLRELDEATALARRVFPYADPGISFTAALAPSSGSLAALREDDPRDPKNMRYWVARDPETREIIGTTGLYTYPDDPGAVWLGWFSVDPACRGRGIGSQLLDLSIELARQSGATHLRLYTSDHPNEAAAQFLYEKKGLRVFAEEAPADGSPRLLYRELALHPAPVE